ncbi:MAG: porin family protein [Bacteroidota bacterium]
MKKTLLLVALSLLISFSAMAQIGVKAGLNLAKQTGNEVPTFTEKYLNSFHFGVFTHKDLIPLLKIRVGLEYSPKGTKWKNGDLYTQGTFNYLELPVLARVKLGPIYGLGGFYGAYALNGKTENNILGVTVSDEMDFEAREMKKLDYGMKFGLGFQTGLGPLHVFAQVEYSFGLQNINSGAGDAMKNSVIGVSVGVLLGGK